MEILLVSSSNSTAVGDLRDSIWIKLVSTGYRIWSSIRIDDSISQIDLTLTDRNPVKEALIMNLPDHRLRRWSYDLIPA
ncbi:hypothetical protein Tco_1210678 [Tanacetum coccineum]